MSMGVANRLKNDILTKRWFNVGLMLAQCWSTMGLTSRICCGYQHNVIRYLLFCQQ